MQQPTAGATRVAVDQAVFTSIGSAMGQGYRLIAASAGVRADERQEITQRSPSHASLCRADADARGMSVYPLRSGRYAIAHTVHAGAEQTERGGLRVHTHVAVLDATAYAEFEYNPVHARDALEQALGPEPMLNPSARLEPLSLDATAGNTRRTGPRELVDRFLPAAAALLGGQRDVLLIDPSAEVILEWALLSLPVPTRQSVAASAGLLHSPSRRMQFTVMDSAPSDPRRFPAALAARAMKTDATAAGSPFEPWLTLIARWWHESRHRDLGRLTSRVQAGDAPTLSRVAMLCEANDAVERAAEDALKRTIKSGGPVQPRSDLERELQERLVHRAIQRLAELEAAGADADR